MPSIHSLLPHLGTAQVTWIFLFNRYNCINDSNLEFHIESNLYQIHQEIGQSIFYYYSQNSSMWKQLSTTNPPLKYPVDIELFAKYQDQRQFMHFMIGLHEDFELTRAFLTSRSLIPSLDTTVKELIFENNRITCHHLTMYWLHALLLHSLPLLYSLLLHR